MEFTESWEARPLIGSGFRPQRLFLSQQSTSSPFTTTTSTQCLEPSELRTRSLGVFSGALQPV